MPVNSNQPTPYRHLLPVFPGPSMVTDNRVLRL